MPYPGAPGGAPMPSPAMPVASAPPPPRRCQAAPAPAARPPAAPPPAAPAAAAPPPPPPPQPAPELLSSADGAASTTGTAAPPAPRGERPADTRGGGQAPGQPLDYTRIPRELDQKFETYDEDGALRPTILNLGEPWSRTATKSLLAAPTTATMSAKEQRDEKNRAFDLLDALSRSGALAIDHASLHVVIAATHCFDKTLLDTVIQGNVNPIEKVERSLLLVATTLHNRDASELILEDQRARFFTYTPRLAPPQPDPEPEPIEGLKAEG